MKLKANAKIYLVSGAECEPLLKVDQQLAQKYAKFMVRRLELGMQATGAKEGVVALKAKYGSAIEALTPLLHKNMRIHILKVFILLVMRRLLFGWQPIGGCFLLVCL